MKGVRMNKKVSVWENLTPEDLIEKMFERTDADGVLYMPSFFTAMLVKVPSVISFFSFILISSKIPEGEGLLTVVLWYRNGFREFTLPQMRTCGLSAGAGIFLVVTRKFPSRASSIRETVFSGKTKGGLQHLSHQL